MGLTISHNAFSGSYGTFHRFRYAVLEHIGGNIPSRNVSPGIAEFLEHDDDRGKIAPTMAFKVAEELTALMPDFDLDQSMGDYLRDFVAGCRRAHAAGEPLEFY